MNKLFSGVVACLILSVSSCAHKKEAHKEESEYQITSPLIKDTTITIEYVSQIRSIRHIEIMAQERGYLEKIFVDEGQYVKKGELLFQIMPNLYEAEQQKAQAEVNFAQIEYNNTEDLAVENIVSMNELAMAKAKLDQAQAALNLANTHLEFTKIRAPFNGIIDRFHVREGSLLEEGEILTELSDNSQMWVYFNVPEAEYLDYKVKLDKNNPVKVNLMLANNKMFNHSGLLETIEADFNNETGNIPFRATFSNPEGLLRHGETGNILLSTKLKNALIIPQKATFEILDKKYVYLVDSNNILHAKQVQIAEELQHIFIIEGGLNESDKILLDGLRKVRENDHISPKFVTAKLAISQLSLYSE
jgi:membrane fusion protein (multidrug efflux system)